MRLLLAVGLLVFSLVGCDFSPKATEYTRSDGTLCLMVESRYTGNVSVSCGAQETK